MKSWYLYLVRCGDGTLYTGIAVDVERRMVEHRGPGKRGAKYLKGRGPLKLARKIRIGSQGAALRAEARVRRMSKEQKEELAAGRIRLREAYKGIRKRRHK